MNTHVVTKRLSAGGTEHAPGTEVDASGWRNARLLEEQRYIKPLSASEPAVKPGPEPAQTQPDEREKRVGRKGKDESGN